MNPLIFVHIPKTAGTSFRQSLLTIYNDKKFLQDYGKNAPETSEKVLHEIYQNDNPYGLLDEQTKVIGGHFPGKKYLNISDLKSVITFVRNPVDRLVSEYRHKQRTQDYSGSILEFAEKPTNRNLMAHYLKTIPVEALGFIGITEKYEQSLELLNNFYGLKVNALHLNAAPKSANKFDGIVQQDLDRIKTLNSVDIAIYNASLINFDWRHRLEDDKTAYVHGMWQWDKKSKKLIGYAFNYHSETPVSLSISIKKDVTIDVNADRFFAIIHRFGGPRRGYVGFSISVDISDEADISCAVTKTGQPILKMLDI